MAGLNLVPNPTIIAVQFGIFLTAFYAIKKLILQPYLALREQRQAATLGQKNDATDLVTNNQRLSAEIDKKITDSTRKLRDELALIRSKAVDRKNQMIAAAEAEAREAAAGIKSSIRAQLEQERSKLPGVVQQLTDELYTQILH